MLSKGFLELARKLVAANTVSSEGTRQAADLLQTLWEHAGLAVRRQVVDGVHVNLAGGPGGGAAGAGGVLLVTHLDTCGEEAGLRGARHFVASELFRQIAPSQVLCGEPSELQIISAHKGYAVVRCVIRDRKARTVGSEGPGIEQLEFSGKAAHSSTPHLGENAILKALAWVKSSGSPVVAARGGSGTNVVPASCLLEVPAPRERGQPEPAATRFLPPRAPQPNLW